MGGYKAVRSTSPVFLKYVKPHDAPAALLMAACSYSPPLFVAVFGNEVAILDYYKSHLEETDETFKWTLNEFSDGLLLFSLMELEVWNPSKNVVNQQQYFESNRGNYEKTFRESQGKVIADYQNYLEKEWLNQLKQNHTIEINSAELSRILNE